jgi:DNA-binding transcriptional ArsR family regulator
MTEAASKPAGTHTITDLEALKAIGDPMRMRIIELLGEARAAKDLARLLGVPKTRLYYHLTMLERHGLIRVADERRIGGVIEKRYLVVAENITVSRSLLLADAPGHLDAADAMVDSIFKTATDALRRALGAGTIKLEDTAPKPSQLVLMHSLCEFTDAQAQRFHEALTQAIALIKETDDETGAPTKPYALTIAYHAAAQSVPRAEDVPQPAHPEKKIQRRGSRD